jgi:hypothetical protein
MRKYRKVLKDEVEDIICDICGKSCLTDCSMGDPAMSEYATLEAVWGYCSARDGERYVCEMCEDCFGRVSAYIDSMRTRAASS